MPPRLEQRINTLLISKCTSPPWRRQHHHDAWPLPATGEASQGRQTKRAAPPRAKVLRRAAGRWGWVAVRRRLRSADHEHAISIPTATNSDPREQTKRQGGNEERDGRVAECRHTYALCRVPQIFRLDSGMVHYVRRGQVAPAISLHPSLSKRS